MRRQRAVPAQQAGNNRLSVNVGSFLVTCAVLFLAVKASDGGFANSIDKITKNLDVALKDLMDDMPQYSNYTGSEVYLSTATFNPRGMAGFYNLTVKFMDWVAPPDFLMDGLIVTKKNSLDVGTFEIGEVLKFYWGAILMLLILALMAVLIPLCGMFFCCCRCCGNCGARSQPCDKKRDLCKKIIQGSLLIVLATALLFCVVCAFASNQQLQDGLDDLPEQIQHSQRDANTYLNGIMNESHHLLVTNYQEFSTVFTHTINKSSEYVMQQLEIWSNATAMMDLYTFVDKLPKVKTSLETLKTDTNTLQASASQLNDAMRKVKKDLLNTLNRCDTSECNNIRNNISQLQTNIDFNKLPDVSPTINRMQQLNVEDLQRATTEGKQKLTNIEREIESNLRDTLDDAISKVNEAGETIKTTLNNITAQVKQVQLDVNRVVYEDVGFTVTDYVKNYGQFRYYGGLAISCTLLLITVCLALGLICGICGKRPDGYSDNCCNKGAGSQFLICAVMLMFLFGIVVAVVTIATFALGVTADRAICYPIRNPNNSTIARTLDDYLSQNVEGISVREIITNCHQNKSIYNVSSYFSNKFNIDWIHQKFDILSLLEEMNAQLDGIISKNFTILNATNEEILEDLTNFDPSINFDQFQDELKQNFTNLSLNEISKKLEDLVDNIKDNPTLEDVKSDVQISILHINTYDEKILIPMKELANKVIDNARQLDTDLKMNASSFSEAIRNLLSEIKEAQVKLQKNGTDILQKVATQFGNMVKAQVDSYLDRVDYVVKTDLGDCGPLSAMINSTIVTVCDRIILPWNGNWISLFLSLLLFIPTIVISVKLASLYQKYKQYGPYVETEYLYDAYADRRDSVPLNSRGAKRGKKKTKKTKQYEERPSNMGGEVVAREYAVASHPPDTRYADMAPKHWEEFPNGGPPQYQRAPTEYERPPPYYYPGSGDQQ